MPAPVLEGAVHDTVTEVADAVVPVTPVGAPGGPGVTDDDAVDADELPTLPTPFATTVNVYEVPEVRPVTVHVVVEPSAVVQVKPPGEDVAV